MQVAMKITNNSKKALVILLALGTIGASSIYYISNDSTQDSQAELSEVVQVNLENASEELKKQSSSIDEKPSEIPENNSEISVLAVNSSSTDLPEDQAVLVTDNKVSESAEVQIVAKQQTETIEAIKPVIVKSSTPLVTEEKSSAIAKEKVQKVESEILEYDPFDLIISSEIKDSGVFEKFDYGVYINSTNQSNGRLIDGDVQIYDNIRSKKISSAKTHSLTGVNDPNNRQHSIRIISTVFGYRPKELSFSLVEPNYYDSTHQTSVKLLSDSVVRVNMGLERLQVGDIAVMWQVFFFRDAAIMQPKSKPQLEDLFTMMNENAEMKIKLHGHTNGNSHGKVIHLGDHDNDDLFSIKSDKHVETVGSAQKLSLYRAETIQHYLVKRGIAQSRIEIKGWGGKKMIHDKHSGQANLNVRVEVEITEN